MFVQLLIAAVPGGYYWIRGKNLQKTQPTADERQNTGTLPS